MSIACTYCQTPGLEWSANVNKRGKHYLFNPNTGKEHSCMSKESVPYCITCQAVVKDGMEHVKATCEHKVLWVVPSDLKSIQQAVENGADDFKMKRLYDHAKPSKQ